MSWKVTVRHGPAVSRERVATLDEASSHASWALLSGPAGGVVGAARLAELAGYTEAIAFDMGGTSTDVCLITDGAAARSAERTIAGLPPLASDVG